MALFKVSFRRTKTAAEAESCNPDQAEVRRVKGQVREYGAKSSDESSARLLVLTMLLLSDRFLVLMLLLFSERGAKSSDEPDDSE